MKNRSLFIILVIICILAPGIHYFISGNNFDNTTIRSILVGIQIVAGLALLLLYGMKSKTNNN